MSRLRWWVHPGAVIAAASVAIIAVVLIATWPMLHWPYPRWAETSAQWHQRFAWAGPIAGAAASWYATRLNPPHRIWNQPRSPRLGVPVVLRHLRLLGLWLIGAYIVALLPLTVQTAIRGGVGEAAPLVMISGVVAMAAAVGCGYVLGTLVSSMVMVPITALALCALNVLTTAGADTFASVAPVLYLEPHLGQAESAPLVVFRVALFLLVAVATVALSATTLLRQGRGEGRNIGARFADVAVVALAPVALIGVALSHQPALFAVGHDAPKVCRSAHGITYCVHTENEPQLDALIAAVDPIILRYGAPPDTLHEVWDQALVLVDTPPPRPDSGIAIVALVGDGTIDLAQSGIIESLAGIGECASTPADKHGDDTTTSVQRDVVAFLSHSAPPSGTFTGMTVPQVQDWIRRNHSKIATCSLNPGDLPQPTATRPPALPQRSGRARPVAATPSAHHAGSTIHSGSSAWLTPGRMDDPRVQGFSS